MPEKTHSPILESILRRIGQPDLPEVLADQLSGTEINTLLLEVFARRVKGMNAGDLLKSYQKNRLVKPADLPVLPLREMELDYLRLFDRHQFEPVELSPVSPLGSCAVVGTTHQHKVLSALRGTEVLADATNALALHVACLKKEKVWQPDAGDRRRFCVIQRHLRTQAIAGAGFTPHFKIAALVTAGYDTGNCVFECEALSEHVNAVTELYRDYHQVSGMRIRLLCHDGYPNPAAFAQKLKQYVTEKLPKVEIEIIERPQKQNAYYHGVQYKIDIDHGGRTWEIGDGGFVNWTQTLLQNRKERMFTTGLGFEFMYRIANNLI
ncbi:MAG TPA: hypothetical protein VK658_00040 [Chryseolinea sp.]|nr:hypothetical protein [Chryseolinea sp.]